MKYQEQFPTIWDTPLKAAVSEPQNGSLKEALLAFWNSAKQKPTV